jgi:hypothetical protein
MEALTTKVLAESGIDETELRRARETLRRLERAWSDFVYYRR